MKFLETRKHDPLKTEFLLSNIYKFSPYLKGSTLRLRYRNQPVNVVWAHNRCLLSESYETHRYTLCGQNVEF
jgi:hypothetical protein